MRKDDAIKFIELMGTTASDRGQWVMTNCPFAKWRHEMGTDKNPSFGIVTGEDRASFYNCLSCKTKGPLAQLPTLLDQFDPEADHEKLRQFISDFESFTRSHEDEEDEFVQDFAPMVDERHLKKLLKVPSSFLKGRRLSKKNCVEYELAYDRGENRIIIPIRDDEGRLVALRGRYIGQEERAKYKEYTQLSPSGKSVKAFGVWYGDNRAINPDKAVILVESELDVPLIQNEYPDANVRGSMGSKITRLQLKKLSRFTKGLICFFDNDMAGKDARNLIVREYRGHLPIYAVREYFVRKDPGEIIEAGFLKKSMASLDKV